jgi:tetratricopeptide (TPR) repeat protein
MALTISGDGRPDDLEDLLDRDVAAALRDWAQGKGGSVRLPSQRWQASGYTGAVLTAIVLEMPSLSHRAGQKLIVKVLPAGSDGRETGIHEYAWRLSRAFAEQYLVRQLHSRYPVGDGRFLMFQESVGNLLEYRTVSKLPPEYQAETCGQVARLVLERWNADEWVDSMPFESRATVNDYLRLELRTAFEEATRWAEDTGLASAEQDWLVYTGDGQATRLPNPVRMASSESLAHDVTIDYLIGYAHGDLHWDNILVPYWEPPQHQRPGPPDAGGIRLIDLATFESGAPLTRDLVALSLSAAAETIQQGPGAGAETALRSLLLDPRPPCPEPLPVGIASTIFALHDAAKVIPQAWRGEWQAQYLLSLQAGALTYTTYSNITDHARRWFFHVAAHAGAEFLRLKDLSSRPVAKQANQDVGVEPEQVVLSFVFASVDGADATRDLQLELTRISHRFQPEGIQVRERGEQPWDTVDLDRPLVRPDVVLFVMTRYSVVDQRCMSQLNDATTRHIPVVPVQVHEDVYVPEYLAAWSPIDLTHNRVEGLAKLDHRLSKIASPAEVRRRIEEDLKATEAKEGQADGLRKRRLEIYNREQRARRADERRRVADAEPGRQVRDESTARRRPEPEVADVVPTSGVRLVNTIPAVAATKFHDRLPEMQRLERALTDPTIRMITIVGPPGFGKTALISELRQRLVAHTAGARIDAFVYLPADGYRKVTAGTVLHDLVQGLPNADEVDRLQDRLTAPVPWRDKLNDVLTAFADTSAVVAIDGAEQLLDDKGDVYDRDLSEVIHSLTMRTGHGVRLILVTADRPVPRSPFRELHKHTCPVELGKGLPFDFAVDFLIGLDRNVALQLSTLSDEQLRQVHRLTGGHPRSLELLVGVLRNEPDKSVEQLLDELEPAQEVANTLLDWNFERLDRTEQRVVQALAVFGRPVKPNAVDFLLRPFVAGIDSGSVLRRLNDRRTVRQDHGHYFLPPKPDAKRVRAGMPPGEVGDGINEPQPYTLIALQHRAADYFVYERRVVNELEHLRPQFSEIDLRIQAKEYRAALELMAEIDNEYLTGWGHSDALLRWREELKEIITVPRQRAHNRSFLVAARQQQEDFDGVLTELRAALRDSPWLTASKDRITLHLQIANAHFDDGRLRRAAWLYRRVIWQCRWSGGLRCEAAGAQLNLALCLARTGRFRGALRRFEAARRVARRMPNGQRDRILALLLVDKGWVLGQLGRTAQALEALREGRDIAERGGDVLVTGRCLNGEAVVLIDSDDASRAIDLASRATEIGVLTRNPQLRREANLNLSLAYLCNGNGLKAADAAEAAVRLSGGLRAVGALGMRGITAFRLGYFETARNTFYEACLKADDRLELEPRDFQAWEAKGLALCGLALTDRDSGYLEKSVAAYRTARNITHAAGAMRRSRLLLGQFGEGADPDMLAKVRRASEAEPTASR